MFGKERAAAGQRVVCSVQGWQAHLLRSSYDLSVLAGTFAAKHDLRVPLFTDRQRLGPRHQEERA